MNQDDLREWLLEGTCLTRTQKDVVRFIEASDEFRAWESLPRPSTLPESIYFRWRDQAGDQHSWRVHPVLGVVQSSPKGSAGAWFLALRVPK